MVTSSSSTVGRCYRCQSVYQVFEVEPGIHVCKGMCLKIHNNLVQARGGQTVTDADVSGEHENAETEDAASGSEWTVGKFCKAIYSEDGIWYEGEIKSVEKDSASGSDYCTVRFLGYGNEETVWCNDLKPSDGEPARDKQIKESGAEPQQIEGATAADPPEPLEEAKVDWKVGDACRGIYSEDGIVYEANIKELVEDPTSGQTYCVVVFCGYLNEENIWLTDLMPSGGEEARQKQEKEASAVQPVAEDVTDSVEIVHEINTEVVTPVEVKTPEVVSPAPVEAVEEKSPEVLTPQPEISPKIVEEKSIKDYVTKPSATRFDASNVKEFVPKMNKEEEKHVPVGPRNDGTTTTELVFNVGDNCSVQMEGIVERMDGSTAEVKLVGCGIAVRVDSEKMSMSNGKGARSNQVVNIVGPGGDANVDRRLLESKATIENLKCKNDLLGKANMELKKDMNKVEAAATANLKAYHDKEMKLQEKLERFDAENRRLLAKVEQMTKEKTEFMNQTKSSNGSDVEEFAGMPTPTKSHLSGLPQNAMMVPMNMMPGAGGNGAFPQMCYIPMIPFNPAMMSLPGGPNGKDGCVPPGPTKGVPLRKPNV